MSSHYSDEGSRQHHDWRTSTDGSVGTFYDAQLLKLVREK